MMRRIIAAAASLVVVLALGAGLTGCSGDKGGGELRPNTRPTISLTQAPIDTVQLDPQTGLPLQYFYAYRLQWSGFDPDGKVDHYLYAVDPPTAQQVAAGQDTVWERTTKNEQIVFFRATRRDPNSPTSRPTSNDFHTFVIKAFDNGGLQSEPEQRVFFSYTVAPTVTITNPPPSSLIQRQVSPSVRITWNGSDPDGQFTQKPIKYKYRLYSDATARDLILLAQLNPTAFRDTVVNSNFAGFDSTSGDTTFAAFANLIPSVGNTINQYLFVIVAFDEAGAYSPVFDLNSSMLLFTAGYANALGPKFTIFNEYITFQYASGGYSRPTNPADRKVVRVQIPAGVPTTWNWIAEATAGANIKYYRWCVDLNIRSTLDDETPRTNEQTDIYHWSQKSNTTTSALLPAFPGSDDPLRPETHWLWIEAEDNNGIRGNAVVYITVVRPTLAMDLLIIDDTRLESDRFQRAPRETLIQAYNNTWPSAAELDTFLYARGGVRWRGLPSPQPITQPGVFQGYTFDTLNTRRGLEDISNAVTLSNLAPYKHVIWFVDAEGATKQGSGTDLINPTTALRFFARGQANPLNAYVEAGGQAWLAGGGIAFASTAPWLARPGVGSVPPFGQEFSSRDRRELAPGRFMYDIPGWQVEIIASLVRTTFLKHVGPFRTYTRSPNMALLPSELRVRSDVTDPVAPPTRSLPPAADPFTYYAPGGQIGVEYISDLTFNVEGAGQVPALDTLVVVQGGLLRTQFPQVPTWVTPTMTYYHPSRREVRGGGSGSVIMTGFAPWDMTRPDCIALVDFVLQGIWGLSRNSIPRNAVMVGASTRPGAGENATPARRVVQGRLPIDRNRE